MFPKLKRFFKCLIWKLMIMQPGACLLKGAPRRPFYEPLRKNWRSNQCLTKERNDRSKYHKVSNQNLYRLFIEWKLYVRKFPHLNQMAIQLLLISTGAATYWASDRVLSHLEGKNIQYSLFSKISIFFFENSWAKEITNFFSLHLDPPPYCGLAQLIFLQSSLSSKS